MLLVFLISLFGLVIIGVPISFSLVGTGFCMMAVKAMGNPRFWSLFTLTQKFTNGVDSVPLLAIPFFMIAGEKKKALPVLSFPSVGKMGVTVDTLIRSSDLQAQGMKLIERRLRRSDRR